MRRLYLLIFALLVFVSFVQAAPTVQSITSAANGIYKQGGVVTITVNFTGGNIDYDNNAGAGSLHLNLNGIGTDAIYSGGNLTNVSSIILSYTVGAGENAAPLNYQSTSSLSLSGGATIKNTGTGTATSLTLPATNNANALQASNVTIDTTLPVSAGITLNYGTGVMVVTLNETLASTTQVDGTKFNINNVSGTNVVTLTNAEVTSVGATSITFTLTEVHRIAAIAISGTAGGDGGAVKLDISAGGETDDAGNASASDTNNSVTETADSTKPTITSATLDYNTGVMVVLMSEGLKVIGDLDGTKFHINDVTGTNVVNVTAPEVTGFSQANKTVTFTLTEAHRLQARGISGTTGGNGGAVVLDVSAAGVTDAANNVSVADTNNPVTETADTTPPAALSATINYNTGVMVITLSEGVAVTTDIDATKFHVNNVTGSNTINLTTPELTSVNTAGLTVTFTLTEVNRIIAIGQSGTTGGDGGAAVLDVAAGGLKDAIGNTSVSANNNILLSETADNTKPTVTSATLDYNTGILVVQLSEGLKVITGADGTKFHINDVTGTNVVTLTNGEVTGFSQANKTVTFTLTEAHRLQARGISGTTGGNGGAVVLDVAAAGVTDAATNASLADANNTVTETADTTAPVALSATIDYNTGIMVVTLSEGVAVTTDIDATKFHVNNVTGTNAINLTTPELTSVNTVGLTVTFTLTEAHRITAIGQSGTTGGDGGAAVLDVSAGGLKDPIGNTSVSANNNILLVETGDTTKPTITSATLDYNTGILVVQLSEGVVSTASITAAGFHINDVTGTNDVTLTTPEVTSVSQVNKTVTFTLTEAHRLLARSKSGTTGGNTGAVVLDVDVASVADAGTNTNLADTNNAVTETADTTAPIALSAAIDYNTGIMVVTLNEGVAVTTDVDATKFHVNNATGTNVINLTTPELTSVNTGALTVTFTLTEVNRIIAIGQSGTTGGDGGAAVLDVAAGGLKDAIGNTSVSANNNILLSETGDTTKPTITSATLDYNTGILVVQLSEGVVSTASITAAGFHINDVTGTNNVTLSTPEITSISQVNKTVTFTLTEPHRISAIAFSGTPGGNGGAVVLDVDLNGVKDAANNFNIADPNNAVTETADTTAPTITSATLDYNNGVMVVLLSQGVKVITDIDGTKFHINDATGTNDVTLTNVEVTGFSQVNKTVTFTLTEAHRLQARSLSGTTGGNGGAVVLDVDAAGVTDAATNTNLADANNTVTETADTTPPAALSATINYNTGVLVVTLSEGVAVTTDIDATKFHVNNVTGTNTINLTTPELTSVNTVGLTVTFTLTEAHRITAIGQSGTPGGDGVAAVLDVAAGGLKDPIGNTSVSANNNILLSETADNTKPTITSATLDYNTGILVVQLSEGVVNTASITATGFHINDATGTNNVTLSTPEVTSVSQVNKTVTFTLTEAHRIAAIALSGTPGGDGTAVVLDVDLNGVKDAANNFNIADPNNTVTETGDTTLPTIISATLDYNNGIMVVQLSEAVKIITDVDGTKFHINDVTGTNVVNLTNAEVSSININSKTVTFTLTEGNRLAAIAISGTTGGNGGAVVLDVSAAGVIDAATNANLADANNTVTETADTTRPTVISATLDYNNGTLVVLLSEGVTGLAAINGTNFHINNVTGTNAVNLSNAEKSSFSGPNKTVTFILTEANRVAAIGISGTPGGDGTAVVLDVAAAGVTDAATNTNLADNNNTVAETADTTGPTITSATLDYNNGVMVVLLSEGVTSTASVNGALFHINDATGTNDVTLSNGEVTSVNQNARTITFTLSEANRLAARALSGTTGGNGGAVVLDVDLNGVKDAGNNFSIADANNTVTETADTTPPAALSATINYGTGVMVVTLSEGAAVTTDIDATKFHINNVTGTNVINLTTPELTSVNTVARTVTFTLTEVNRIIAIGQSGTAGGDGGAAVLDVSAGGLKDAIGNTSVSANNNIALGETVDNIKPTVTSATVNYGTGILIVQLSEGLKTIGGATSTQFNINNVTGTNVITLSPGELTGFSQANKTVTFTLTETHRISAIAISGTPGGDGTAVVLDVAAGGLTDAAGNVSLVDNNNPVTETADAIAPTVTSATLDYNNGVLVVLLSEGLPNVGSVNGAQFHINDVTGTNDVTLSNGEVTSVNQNARTVTFTLTEANRLLARSKSGTTGGNGGAVVLDVAAGGVTDLSGNANTLDNNNPVTETADTTPPAALSAVIDYNTGVLVVTLTEGIAVTTDVDATKFHVNNVSLTNVINLTTPELTSVNTVARTITFTLTEVNRIIAIGQSGTAGGDGGAAVLDVSAGGLKDPIGNTSVSANNNILLGETADSTKPTVTSATLDYNNGVLVVQLSEGLKNAAAVSGALFHINNVTGTNVVNLSNGEVTSVSQANKTVTFTLTETNRVAAIAISGTPGGDGTAVVLDVAATGITDAAGNTSLADTNNPVTETGDTTLPTVASATLNYNNGVLVVQLSEAVNALTSFDGTKFHINNVTGTNVVNLSNAERTSFSVAAKTITFTLTEVNRLAAIAISGTPGGDGTAVILDVAAAGVTDAGLNNNLVDNNNVVTETGDTTLPTITSATLNYGTGVLVVQLSEAVKALGNVSGANFHINNVTGTNVVNLSDAEKTSFSIPAKTVTFTLTEVNRIAAIAISGTPGGDGTAVVLDVAASGVTDAAGNNSLVDNNNPVTETADSVLPTVTSSTIDYGTGILVVTLSEGVTGLPAINGAGFHINNTTGTNVVTLSNGERTSFNQAAKTITFTLTQINLAAALAISGTPGGDGSAVVLDVDAGGITDAGTNPNAVDPNNAVTETADTVVPAGFLVGSVLTQGPIIVANYWNSTNTGVNIDVPIANDGTLLNGKIQIQGKISTDVAWTSIGSTFNIGAFPTTQTVNLTKAQFESIANFNEGKTIQVRAIITDKPGNSTTGTQSGTTLFVDRVAPTLAITRNAVILGSLTQTTDNILSFALAFNELMNTTTFATADITLNKGGTVNTAAPVPGDIVTGDNQNYTFTINTITGDGTLGITVGPNIQDVAGNNMTAAQGPSATFGMDNTFPSVQSIAINTTSTPITSYTVTNGTSATSAVFRVIFSESVTNVVAGSFVVTPGHDVSGADLFPALTTGGVTGISGSGTTWDITVGSLSETGWLRIDYNNTLVKDLAGNPTSASFLTNFPPSNSGSAPGNQSFSIVYPEPPAQPSGFSVGGTTTLSKTVTWNPTLVPVAQATHYLVMIRESVTGAAFLSPVDGTPIADDTDNSDGLQTLNIANTGAANLTAIFSGLRSGYSHDFKIYAYTLSANNTSDNIDYLTTLPPTITNSLTNIATFTKIKNVSAPAGISSLINAQHGIAALTFDISDDDGSAAVDNSPTKFNTLVVTQGGSDTSPSNDWTQVIAGAELYDATTGTTYQTGVVAANTITFSSILSSNSSQVGFIPDNASKTYNLMIWLQNPLSVANKKIIDNLQFDFVVNNASITYNNVSNNQQSSQLASSQLAQTGLGKDVIQVVAQKLVFDPLPQTQIGVASSFPNAVAPTVKALDNNNNWDLDYNANISVTNSASLTQFSGHTVFPLGGVLTLNNYQLLAPGTTTLQVTHTSGSAVVDATTSPTTITAVLSTKTVITAAAGIEPASISSLTTALSGATGVQQNAVQNFDFTITDDVAADGTNFTDNDGLPTLIPNLIIKQDASNDAVFTDWRKIIAGAELSSGAKTITGVVEPTLGKSLIFSSINTAVGELGNIPDGTAKVYVLKIWLKNPVDPTIIDLFDDKSLAFLISQSEITVGSSPTSSTMQSSNTNSIAPTNKITVDATQLDFTTPNANSAASLNVDFPIVVKARDANNNLDIDFNGTIQSFTNASSVSMTGMPNVGTDAFAFGQISYPNLRYTSGNNNDNVTLAISAGAPGACNGTTTICSITPPAPTTPTIILSSSSSSVLVFDPAFTYSNRLAYIYNQDITSSATSLALARYKLFDGDGTNNDLDGASTNISSITFAITTLVNGTGSPVNGNKDINQISLYDNTGSEIVSTRTTLNNASTVTFSGLSIITPGDFTSTTFTVRASFNSTAPNVQDKDIIQLSIINVDQVSGSKLDQTVPAITGGTLDNATNVTGATPTPNTVNKIDVIATKLDFVTQPGVFAGINQPVPTGTLRANDQGGLIDLEFNFAVVLTTPTATPVGSFTFAQGFVDLTGMTYSTVGNGTLTVTANGINSNQTGTTLGLANVSTQCNHVDVLHVNTTIATGGVITTTNLAGGAIDKVIFGITFTAPYQNVGEPKLNSFRIGFGNPGTYPLNTIFSNVRIFENTSATFGGSNITSFGGTVAFDNTTNSDLVITVPSRSLAVPLSYFVEVDVVATASGATPQVLPSVKDLGFGNATDTNIGTTQGSATSNVSGQTYNFSAIFPPTLVSSYPASGQLNIDITQPDITLTFSVPVWSLDGKIYIYDAVNDALVGSIPLSSSGANSGEYALGTVANLGNPLKFNLQSLPANSLKPDHVYYVKISQGVFNGSASASNAGVMDQAGNLYAGITVAGTLYFKTANPNPPNMLATPTAAVDPSISNATVTGGIISAIFDQPGKAYYLVLPVGTATPTPTQIFTGTHPSMVASGNFAITQITPNSQFGVITPTAAMTAGATYDVWVSSVSYSEKSGVQTQIPATAPLHYGSSAKVSKTGTITATVASSAVTGVGTLFTTQLVTGRTLFDNSSNAIGIIASIQDNTHLTLTNNASNAITAGAYKASGFEIGAAGPTLQFIPAAASSSVNLNVPSIAICTNAYQTLNQPIVITESSTKADFSSVGNQKFNLVLPSGFVFDATLTSGKPAYGMLALNGADFSTVVTGSGTITSNTASATVIGVGTAFIGDLSAGDKLYDASGSTLIGTIASITNNTTIVLTANAAIAVSATAYKENFVIAGSPHLGFVGNTILTVSYFNNGSTTIDNLVISGLRIISASTASGDITRFGGNALISSIPDLSKVATIGATNASGIAFSNSYSIQTFNNKIVTTIPDNFSDPNLSPAGTLATLLIPDPPAGDYGASTFSGAGVNGSLLNLTAVTLGTPFNVTITHKDNNGCPSTNFNQYTVYDHTTAIADLNPQYCSVNSNFQITNPTALATVGIATHDITFNKLQSYYLDDLKVDVPVTATDPSDGNVLLSDQIIFGPIGGAGWSNVLRSFLITKLTNVAAIPITPIGPGGGFLPLNNPLPGHEYFNYRIDEAIILNAKSIDAAVPKNPYDYFIATSPQGNTYYTGGSLGKVQFTGTYQSIANASVKIPLQQNVEFFVPAVPIIETGPGSYLDRFDGLNPPGPVASPPNPGSSNKGTPVFCQLGGLIIINGYPAASASSKGTFTLRDAATNAVIPIPPGSGFIDNSNGSASIDPTLLNNSYKDIKIVYDFKENNSPCPSTATQIIRVTPNPIANYSFSSTINSYVATTTSKCVGQPITFVSSSASADPINSTIKQYDWNFGDPNSSTNVISGTSSTVSHTYDLPSTLSPLGAPILYGVNLNVTSFWGCASVPFVTSGPPSTTEGPFTQQLDVGGIPVVKFKLDGVSTADAFRFNSNDTNVPFPTTGTSFPASGAGSNNAANNTTVSATDHIVKYDWYFGDTGNTIKTRSGLASDVAFNNDIVQFTYNAANIGARKVDLVVTTSLGCVNSLSLQNSFRDIVVLSRNIIGVGGSYFEDFENTTLPTATPWQIWLASTPTQTATVTPSWVLEGTGRTVIKPGAANGAKFWTTDNGSAGSPANKYNPSERSALYSPSLDLSGLVTPMISFDNMIQLVNSDGLVLEYSLDNLNISNPLKTWTILGKIGDGVSWVTDKGIAAQPGNQTAGLGWTGTSKTSWLTSKHTLDTLGTPGVPAGKVVFRFALASVTSPNVEGVAIDNVRFGDRTRTILLESFANTANTTASIFASGQSEEKYQNTNIATFPGTTLGTQVIKINYHVNFPASDPLNNDNPADPSSRALYYGIAATPRSALDGKKDSLDRFFTQWGITSYGKRSLQLAGATMVVNVVSASGKISTSVKVTAAKGNDLPANTILQIAVLENSIGLSALSTAQQALVKTGETTFSYVLKKMVPNAAGTRFGTPLLSTTSRTFPATGTFDWIPDPTKLHTPANDLSVVVFLQNESTNEVYQVYYSGALADPSIITGLEPIAPEQIAVYPVPANQEMHIQLPGVLSQPANLQMIDQVGRVTLVDRMSEGTLSKVINTSDLSSGVYILQIDLGNGNMTRKKVMVVH